MFHLPTIFHENHKFLIHILRSSHLLFYKVHITHIYHSELISIYYHSHPTHKITLIDYLVLVNTNHKSYMFHLFVEFKYLNISQIHNYIYHLILLYKVNMLHISHLLIFVRYYYICLIYIQFNLHLV